MIVVLPSADVVVERVELGDDLVVVARTCRPNAHCPLCGVASTRPRSRYCRSLADLSAQGTPVRLKFWVRRFACDYERCAQRVFTERLPALAAPHARRTQRLSDALLDVGLALGGEAAARLLATFGLTASADTLLRLVHRAPLPERPAPRVLGVDEWARRRGHTYGMILVDLERNTAVDLLDSREADALAAWLTDHPGVEVIARDRSEAFADGARRGAPDAVQVVDRWHLLKNVGDLLERLLQQHRPAIEAATRAAVSSKPEASPTTPTPAASAGGAPLHPLEALRAARRAARIERYERVHALAREGVSIHGISARLGISRETARKYLRASTFPERAPRRPKIGALSGWEQHLRRRWEEGCRDAMVLWKELRARGFGGSLRTVQRYVESWREAALPSPHPSTQGLHVQRTPTARRPSPHQVRWWLMLPSARLTQEQRVFVEHLVAESDEIRTGRDLACGFHRLLATRDIAALEPWLRDAEGSQFAVFRDFARNLRPELAEVEAALPLPWSNGQTEGQITKVKMLKRQMYGRASVPLLRQRILLAA